MIRKKSFVIILALFPCYCLLGQSIFSNDITGTNPQSDNPYTTGQIVDANLTVSGIGRGVGIIPPAVATNDRYNARTWDMSFQSDDYFYFTLTPNSNYEIDFASLVFYSQRSNEGPTSIAVRSSLDGYTNNIGSPIIGPALTPTQSTIDLSSATYQNITSPVTFRIYAWSAGAGTGAFSINDFIFNGTVSSIYCPANVVWDGTSWSATPDITTAATINGNYNTSTHGSFSACTLNINTGFTLTVNDSTYVAIENDVVVDGNMVVESKGAFVQNNDLATVTENGTITVEKYTPPLNAWYEYVYWSSPVVGETIGSGLSDSDYRRRYKFNAQNFLDATKESNNNGAVDTGQDDIDDNGNDWQWVNGSTAMQSGVGYASTHDEIIFNSTPGSLPRTMKYTFEGPFNNGVVSVFVYRNDAELNDNNWNLIGNPYPSAIDVVDFFDQNLYHSVNNPTGTLEGNIYLWSHHTVPSSSNNGNEQINFSTSDYAMINGSGGVAGGDGETPDTKIPSCQGFFVHYSNDGFVQSVNGSVKQGEVIFNNAMRVADTNSNSKFFRVSGDKREDKEIPNKLWINLTSDNGIFSQTLVSYLDGATDGDDGSYYDAIKNTSSGVAAFLYTSISESSKKYAIQGKEKNSLSLNENIKLGFKTSINVATLYKLSISKLEGGFLGSHNIFLKDNLLQKVHDLSSSDYTFSSDVGEFNNRFQIVFNDNALTFNEALHDDFSVSIIDLGNDLVNFKTSNDLKIANIKIYDTFGRELYNFEAQKTSENYNLSKLTNTMYISKITLSNGAVITKKAIKN